MITSKQRSKLRSMANTLEPLCHIGKGGISDSVVKQLDELLELKELVKVNILKSALLDTKQVCSQLAERLSTEPVQSIGSRFVLYRESVDNKTIEL